MHVFSGNFQMTNRLGEAKYINFNYEEQQTLEYKNQGKFRVRAYVQNA